jgi:hypothetical protein
MKTSFKIILALAILGGSTAAFSQSTAKNEGNESSTKKTMNTYVIERQIPDAGKFTPEELRGISQTSCRVIKDLGPDIEWVQSYVTDDKIFCIYKATDEEILREHAEKGGFPINSINQMSTVISPATAQLSETE